MNSTSTPAQEASAPSCVGQDRVAVCTENLSAGVAHLASALKPLESPEGNRKAANSPAPSRMKEVEHGAAVDNVA
jgi:hypothetical protein